MSTLAPAPVRGENEEDGKQLIKNDKLLFYILKSYGINDAIRASKYIFKLFGNIKKSKIYKCLNTLLPLGIVSLDLYEKIKKFYNEKNKNILDDLYEKIAYMIQCNKDDIDTYGVGEMKLNNEMFQWILKYPNVENFEIINYYDFDTGNKIETINLDDINCGAILIRYNKIKYLYVFEVVEMLGDKICYPKNIYTSQYEWSNFQDLKLLIYKEYIKSLDFSKNVIQYNNDVNVRKRVSDVNFDFKSIDFNKIKSEIINSIENGYRRGYMLVGNPGTSKTSFLLRLENELRQYPILYVTPENISEEWKINTLFAFLETINPCIVCFEDMDSYGMDSKNKKVGVFLNHIENSKEKMKIIYIATINNSKGINYSLMRPGRFDEIIEFKEPIKNSEIYDVMKNHYEKQKINNEFYVDKEFIKRYQISWLTYWKLKKYKLTHADYCEIIQKIILLKKEFTNNNIIESRNNLLLSKKSIVKYKRNDNDEIATKRSLLEYK